MRYLLDTNVCIGWLRAHPAVGSRLRAVGFAACAISEVTLAELYFGVANSPARYQAQQEDVLAAFLPHLPVLPILPSLRVFAQEKARLRQAGRRIEDFDLLIGTSAVFHHLTLVTGNTRHFADLNALPLEDWSQAPAT